MPSPIPDIPSITTPNVALPSFYDTVNYKFLYLKFQPYQQRFTSINDSNFTFQ
jgi:hypothetical protein